MPPGRYVVLGLASPRAPWFREVAQWATAAAIPVEFVKCLSIAEVRARLAGARPFSALLVDTGLPGLDRDLVETAASRGAPVIVVGDARPGRDWRSLGASGAIGAGFGRKELLDVLAAHARLIGRAERLVPDDREPPALGSLVAVCGPGGTGTSTVAIALAQGLASARQPGPILLADFALHAEQAMLHDSRDVVPGIPELVELCRSGRPSGADVAALTYAVAERGYALLLGLRRSSQWASVRPKAFEVALESLREHFGVVVADVDADIEGEDAGGSMDIEERNVIARTTLAHADVVVIVGMTGMKGLHSIVRVLAELLTYGVPAARLLPVLNQAARGMRARARTTKALAALLPAWAGAGLPAPIYLPERNVEGALRDGIALPDALATPVVRAVEAVTARAPASARRPAAPLRVTPGTVGSWSGA